MTPEEIKSEIESLETHVQWLLEHGSNDEEMNSRLRFAALYCRLCGFVNSAVVQDCCYQKYGNLLLNIN